LYLTLPTVCLLQVAVLFKPQELGPWSGRLTAVYNNSTATTTTIALHGSAQEPQLRLGLRSKGSSSSTGNRLVFRPTCVGAQSRQELVVVNPCEVPVGWAWRISRLLQGVVTVEPQVRAVGGRWRGEAGQGRCGDNTAARGTMFSHQLNPLNHSAHW
jgi:hypothetical protein